jgi:transglutaminase-like putative cysteine protease
VTLLAFCFLPRDFNRRGLLGDRLKFRPGTLLSAGFSEEVELGREGAYLGGGDKIIARIQVTGRGAAGVSPYWRGATLHRFDGREWRPARTDPRHGGAPWRVTSGGAWVRHDLAAGTAVQVEHRDATLTRLFAPLRSRRLEVIDPALRSLAQPMADHTFVLARGGRDSRTVRYRVLLSSDRPRPSGRPEFRPSRGGNSLLRIERGAMPNRLRSMAGAVSRALPSGAQQHEIVTAMAARLRDSYSYLAPGEEGAARNLVDFVNGAEGGHCEYFATALALMLRSRGIPCRLVTGFRSEEWNEDGTTLTIRARHAHAWVEVLDPRAGWYTADATPSAAAATGGGEGLFAGIRRSLGRFWDSVTGFDREDRDRVLAWLGALPGRLAGGVRDHPLAAGGIALLLGFLVALRFRRRRGGPVAVRGYVAAVRRSGLRLRSGETPRELLVRARAATLAPKRLARLETATAVHEAERYRA